MSLYSLGTYDGILRNSDLGASLMSIAWDVASRDPDFGVMICNRAPLKIPQLVLQHSLAYTTTPSSYSTHFNSQN